MSFLADDSEIPPSESKECETSRARLLILLAITSNGTSSPSGLSGRIGEDWVVLTSEALRRRARRREYVASGLRDECAIGRSGLEMVGVGEMVPVVSVSMTTRGQTDANISHVCKRLFSQPEHLTLTTRTRYAFLDAPRSLAYVLLLPSRIYPAWCTFSRRHHGRHTTHACPTRLCLTHAIHTAGSPPGQEDESRHPQCTGQTKSAGEWKHARCYSQIGRCEYEQTSQFLRTRQ